MKYVYTTVAGLSIVALACAPAVAGDKSKTSDTQQIPKSDSSVTVDPKTDASPSVGSPGAVTTDSPSASPPTAPSTPGATDSTVNPSTKSDAPAASPSPATEQEKPKY